MKKLNIEEMKNIKAGAGITGALINAVLRSGTVLIDIGRYMGSGIRRLVNNQLCGF